MESIFGFLADNYAWFILASVVLLFAIIGFVVDEKKRGKKNFEVETADAVAQPTVNLNETPEMKEAPAMPTANKTVDNNEMVDDSPSLDNFESTVNEVDVGLSNNGPKEDGVSLVIDGNQNNDTIPTNVEASMPEATTNSDAISLVIEDKPLSENNNQTVNNNEPLPEETPVSDEPTLIIEDKKDSNNGEKKSIFE